MKHSLVTVLLGVLSCLFIVNLVFGGEAPPNDTYYDSLWALRRIQARPAWGIAKGNSNDYIAAIDDWNGTSSNSHYHSDLWPKQVTGWDRWNGNEDFYDMGSGMWTGGLAAAATNNQNGITGLAWNNMLMPIRVSESGSIIYAQDFADGISNAVNLGAKVLLVCPQAWSNHWDQEPSIVSTALSDAQSAGCILIGEAGSDYWTDSDSSSLYWPGRDSKVLCVGGTDSLDKRVSGYVQDGPIRIYYRSHFGSNLDLVAPCGKDWRDWEHPPSAGLWTTHDGHMEIWPYSANYFHPYYNGSDWYVRAYYGTRGSAAYVAGLAALLLQKYSNYPDSWKHNKIANIIRASADDQVGNDPQDTPGWDQYKGFGRINAYKALSFKVDAWTWQDTLASGYNNGRKMVYDSNGTLHMVWDIGADIYYQNSTDNGQTWGQQIQVSGDPYPNTQYEHSFPSIAVDSQNRILIVWQTMHLNVPPPLIITCSVAVETRTAIGPPLVAGVIRPGLRPRALPSMKPKLR